MGTFIIVAIVIVVIYSANKETGPNKKENRNLRPYSSPIRLNEKRAEIEDVKLNDEQQKIFDTIENGNENVYITGKAGTGKSTLLQYFHYKSKKRLVVVAPTGIAALNVGGQTINSLFRIPPGFITKDKLRIDDDTALLLRNIDAVVIDEISMVRVDLMDAIDHVLRISRGNNKLFGGVQIIMFGDLYQLPPVVEDPELEKYFTENFGGYYFFNADVWRKTHLGAYELKNILRQEEENFKKILNDVRSGKVSNLTLEALNQRMGNELPNEGVVTLATTNASVNQINNNKLAQLNENIYEYSAVISGQIDRSYFPTEERLQLKKGAQVMFVKNDKFKRWVNGTLGIIHELNQNEIKVNIDGFIYSIPQETWNKIKYYYNRETKSIEEETISSFTQYPIKLAWAVTIHKSQGKTYESIIVDLGWGAFAHGQTYVALSRCKTFGGLFLKRKVLFKDIIVDPQIVQFMNRVKIIS